MKTSSGAAIAVALFLLLPPSASGTVLTLDGALERARRAPAIQAARLRPDEARGGLAAASALLRDNPVVEGAAGRRDSDRGVSTDIDASISQTFETGGRRRSRIDAATATVEREAAEAESAAGEVLAQVASSFLRGLASEGRLRILRAGDAVAADLLRMAERRHEAGDIADLDANMARIAASRARADVRAAEAAHDRAIGDLRALLGMDAGEPLELHGELRGPPGPRLEELLAAAAARPDIRALNADVQAAEAEVRLGRGFTWPDLGVRAGYQREEDADIPFAGISVSLPVFATGQEQRIGSAARARRLRLELEARRRAADVQIRTAYDAHRRLQDAVSDLERSALPLLDDNDALSRRGYEAGEVSLPAYLLVRRETIGARLDHLDKSLEAALSGIELEARAGVLR